jgi:integrase
MKARGIYENPAGSGVWWVNYYAQGKRHREKAGRKSDAVALYQKRKADARRKLKLPELVPGRVVTFGQLSTMAVEHARTHLKTACDYVTKNRVLREPFGERPADSVTPQEIDQFLSRHCQTPATANRYRAFMSLAYRLGMANGKVASNPARLVRLRTEHNARLRFLSRDEYATLLGIIRRDNPEHAAAFIVSVYTGMRRGEQFSLTWEQVDFKRKMIRLTETKNGSARNVPLNSIALVALESQAHQRPLNGQEMASWQKPAQSPVFTHPVENTPARRHRQPTDATAGQPGARLAGVPVFPMPGAKSDCRWWFLPALAKAGITGYTWHGNRHTFCSWLAIAGVSTKEIQVLAGHKTIAMAARYAHLSPEATASASERLVIA